MSNQKKLDKEQKMFILIGVISLSLALIGYFALLEGEISWLTDGKILEHINEKTAQLNSNWGEYLSIIGILVFGWALFKLVMSLIPSGD